MGVGGRAEVDELGVAPVVEHDVLRLDVAVANVLGALGHWGIGAFRGNSLRHCVVADVLGALGHWGI